MKSIEQVRKEKIEMSQKISDILRKFESEEKPRYPDSNIVTDMMICPPIEEDKHFCHIACLKEWINKNL